MKVKLSKVSFSQSEKKLASKVINSGWLTHGPYNKKFEKKFSKYLNVRYSLL